MRFKTHLKSFLVLTTLSQTFYACSISESYTKDAQEEKKASNTEQRLKLIKAFSGIETYLTIARWRDLFLHGRLEIQTLEFDQNIKFADKFIGHFSNDDTPKVEEDLWREEGAWSEEGIEVDARDKVETRTVEILKAKSIDENNPPKIIVSLHGFMTNKVSQNFYFGFHKDLDIAGEKVSLVEKLNAIVMMPNGLKDRPGKEGAHFWSTGQGEPCCNFWQVQGGEARVKGEPRSANDALTLDYDVNFIETAVKTALETYPNNGEVYLLGHSNGAFLAHKIACNSQLPIKGVIALAGVIPNNTKSCQNYESMSILQVHGNKDTIIDYDAKAPLFEGWDPLKDKPIEYRYQTAQATYEYYSSRKGCAQASASSNFQVRGKNYLAPLLNIDENITEAIFRDCGEKDRVGLWTIENGSHIPLFHGSLRIDKKVKPEESFVYRAMQFVTGGDFEMK